MRDYVFVLGVALLASSLATAQDVSGESFATLLVPRGYRLTCRPWPRKFAGTGPANFDPQTRSIASPVQDTQRESDTGANPCWKRTRNWSAGTTSWSRET